MFLVSSCSGSQQSPSLMHRLWRIELQAMIFIAKVGFTSSAPRKLLSSSSLSCQMLSLHHRACSGVVLVVTCLNHIPHGFPVGCQQRDRMSNAGIPTITQKDPSVLPQHWMTEEEDLCNQQRNFRVDQEEPEPPQIKEELEEPEPLQIQKEQNEPEPPQMKEEQEEPEPPQIKEELEEPEPLQIQKEQNEPEPPQMKEEQEEPEPPQIKEEKEEPGPPQTEEELEEPEPPQTEDEQEEPEPPQIKEEQEEPEPPQMKEEQEEPEPPQIKEEPGELCINQDEDQLDLKQETDTLMEIPTYEEDENSEADLNNQQSFNVTDSQDEDGNQHEEPTSTTDEETDPLNGYQRKRRDRSHVQNVDSSHVSADLLQCWMTKEEDLCIHQRSFRVEREEPQLPQIKKEPGELYISQDEDQLDLKQETDTLMEIPTYEEDENSEADLNNQQSFNVTDSQDEEGNQHEESTSTTDEETGPQNRDQRKRRDRSQVQSVDSSHVSAGVTTAKHHSLEDE
ncbi:uncharacterized protein LOC144986893 isoform X3 [Oryzias latipes]